MRYDDSYVHLPNAIGRIRETKIENVLAREREREKKRKREKNEWE